MCTITEVQAHEMQQLVTFHACMGECIKASLDLRGEQDGFST
jgi:hypothetical protein